MGEPLDSAEGFEWDAGNKSKSLEKHGVTPSEAEEVLLNNPIAADSPRASAREPRWVAFGKSFSGRALAVAFTMRDKKVRVISARPMSRREREKYD